MSSFLMSCEDVLVDLCAMGPARAVVWSLFQQGPLWSVGRAKSCWSQLLLVGWGCHGVVWLWRCTHLDAALQRLGAPVQRSTLHLEKVIHFNALIS